MTEALVIDSGSGVQTPPSVALVDEEHTEERQYVTFQVAKEQFGFTMQSVLEIIRLPSTIKVPLTPIALVGLTNLRGRVLPIMDLHSILKTDCLPYDDRTRVIICDVGTPVGFVVDSVSRIVSVPVSQIDQHNQGNKTLGDEMSAGVIKQDQTQALTQLLNISALVSQEFREIIPSATQEARIGSSQKETDVSGEVGGAGEVEEEMDQLVCFYIDEQEYSFNLMDVEEIVRMPKAVSRVPKASEHVLGLINLRGRLLPLVILRKLFDLDEQEISEDCRVLVINISSGGGGGGGKESIGLVVDGVREVLRVAKQCSAAIPEFILSDSESTSLERVCRLDGGKRLITMLCVDSVFAHPSIREAIDVGKEEGDQSMTEEAQSLQMEEHDDDNIVQLVVFNLGNQEFGISIDDVQEITRVPDQLDKVPKTEGYVEGMVNLRGSVLPVIDMRTRFSMERSERNDRQRIIIISLEDKHTGFIVDSVAEVLRFPSSNIEDAPHLSKDQTRLMGRVVNLKKDKRMIQVLEGKQLLIGV